MASNIVTSGNPVHFSLLSDEVLPKGNDNKLITTTEQSKTDEVVEDEVFVNENETARGAASFQKESERVADTDINRNSTVPSSIRVTSQDAASSTSNTSPTNSVSVPPTTTTTRRPSYTSKAPSALTNLPKIDDNLQTFGLHVHNTALLEKRNSISSFEQDDTLRPVHKDLLSLHGQASFESIDHDEYSNPGTPTSNNSSGHNIIKFREKSRMRADVLSKGKWEMAAKESVLTVKCRDQVAELHKQKFGSGSKGKCIKVGDRWHTPIEFEAMAGRASCKDWKRSIRFHGHHLQKLIEDQYLTLHAISCTCGICCGDDTLTGPVKLFQSVKRKRSHINIGSSPGPYKRKSFSDEYRAYRERGGSLSVDSEVFSVGQEDNGMPPMTPLTPITPLTPHTPFGANCLTPLPVGVARPASPPKSIMLQVPVSQPPTSIGIPVKEVVHQQHHLSQQTQQSQQQPQQQSQHPQHSIPPPTPTKLQPTTELTALTQQPWAPLEEMAASLVIMANKLKLMIEQAKIQSEALKDSAVTQAKIQAENEKAEIIRRTQFGTQHGTTMQIISVGPNGEQLPQTHFTVHVPEVCQNCGREALLKCTGCNKSYYCGPYCQSKDWIVHRSKCRTEGLSEDAMSQQQPVTSNHLNVVEK